MRDEERTWAGRCSPPPLPHLPRTRPQVANPNEPQRDAAGNGNGPHSPLAPLSCLDNTQDLPICRPRPSANFLPMSVLQQLELQGTPAKGAGNKRKAAGGGAGAGGGRGGAENEPEARPLEITPASPRLAGAFGSPLLVCRRLQPSHRSSP